MPQVPSVVAVWPAGKDAVGSEDVVDVVGVDVVGADVGGVVVGGMVVGSSVLSPQVPNSGLHPVPQYSGPSPHHQNWEQQPPEPEPAQVVLFPHMPFTVGVKVPMGGVTSDVVVGVSEVVRGVEVEPLSVGDGRGSPSHQPKSGWHPTRARQNWSLSPQKPNCEQHWFPGHTWLPLLAPHVPAACRRPSCARVSRTPVRRPVLPNTLTLPWPVAAAFDAPARPRVAARPISVHRMVVPRSIASVECGEGRSELGSGRDQEGGGGFAWSKSENLEA